MKSWIPIKPVIAFFTILGVAACEDSQEPTRTFVIRKGEHFSSTRVSESLQSDVLEFDAMLGIKHENFIYFLASTFALSGI